MNLHGSQLLIGGYTMIVISCVGYEVSDNGSPILLRLWFPDQRGGFAGIRFQEFL
jgi:hypothetical protein